MHSARPAEGFFVIAKSHEPIIAVDLAWPNWRELGGARSVSVHDGVLPAQQVG